MSRFRISLLGILMLASFQSSMASDVTIGIPTYVGSGCPANSADAVLVPDGSVLSVGYSDFQVEALPRKAASKRCKLSIPIQVASGVQLIMTQTEFEGFLQLPQSSLAKLHSVSRLFQGTRLKGLDLACYAKRGPYDGSLFIAKSHRYSLRTGCGGTYRLEVDTEIGLVNSSRNEAASFTLDGTNVAAQSGAVNLQLSYASCR